MARMLKRHFLQQAKKLTLPKVDISKSYMSEKLDGQRAFWDGGFTYNMPVSDIPWANTEKDKKEFYSTGLWSRYGKPIFAPLWFTNSLPPIPLDGELWAGRGRHQFLRSAISKHIPIDHEWAQVSFCAFDAPSLADIFYDSYINIPNYEKEFNDVRYFVESAGAVWKTGDYTFQDRYKKLRLLAPNSYGLPQSTIPAPTLVIVPNYIIRSHEVLEEFMSQVLQVGGEGIIIRNKQALYLPERNDDIIKVKPYLDDEATVIGYVTGRETSLGSKLLGLMGALQVSWKGKIFELSGFTNQERKLVDSDGDEDNAFEWAQQNPATTCPDWISAKFFPRGSKITFRYRELTDAGIPKEASYMRRHL